MAKPFVRVAALQQNQAIVDKEGKPNPFFLRALNDVLGNLAEAINTIAAIPEIQEALLGLDEATQAALDAAAAAQGAADGVTAEQSLVNSYIDPDSVLSATDTTITIASHDRIYPTATGATTVTVFGASIAATAPGTVAYVSYSDPARTGGAVTFTASTTPPTQTGNTHVVGAVTIPAPGNPPVNGGAGPLRPGFVEP